MVEGCDYLSFKPDESPSETIRYEYYKNGNIESQITYFDNKKNGIAIYYFSNGFIKTTSYYHHDQLNGESLWFFINGNLDAKVNYQDNKENGLSYYFFESGSLQSYRRWYNGLKIGYANDYYDESGQIKSILYYNDEGHLIYRKDLDEKGNLISIEGAEPF